MPQLIEFKHHFIRICPTNSSHLLQSKDRGKSWEFLFDGSVLMGEIMDLAADSNLVLVDTWKGFFISNCGVFWTKIEDLKQLEDLKVKY